MDVLFGPDDDEEPEDGVDELVRRIGNGAVELPKWGNTTDRSYAKFGYL